MTDKELLELAAKAAEIRLYWHINKPFMRQEMETMDAWNPLTDDGDALRLAVKLKLAMFYLHGRVIIGFNGKSLSDDEEDETRRAIVRAAAEIGKSL